MYKPTKDKGFMGMTLRDWFAGQAVMGLAIGYWNNVNFGKAENLAEAAYEIADAMLKAREAKS